MESSWCDLALRAQHQVRFLTFTKHFLISQIPNVLLSSEIILYWEILYEAQPPSCKVSMSWMKIDMQNVIDWKKIRSSEDDPSDSGHCGLNKSISQFLKKLIKVELTLSIYFIYY